MLNPRIKPLPSNFTKTDLINGFFCRTLIFQNIFIRACCFVVFPEKNSCKVIDYKICNGMQTLLRIERSVSVCFFNIAIFSISFFDLKWMWISLESLII